MSRPLHILLIGATGFTGKRVVAYLQHKIEQGQPLQVSVLCRKDTPPPVWALAQPLLVYRGDLNDTLSLEQAIGGKDVVINVASLGFGHAPGLVQACEKAGVKRAVFTSTTAIFTQLNAPSKAVRTAAEQTIQNSTLDWTILRPTMIYGRKGDRNMERLARWLKKMPLVFVPGSAQAAQQPVFVDDVAAALVEAALHPATVRKAYNISGAAPLTFAEVVHTLAAAMGRRAMVVPAPLAPLRWLLRRYEAVSSRPWLKEEQLLRLNEDKVFEHTTAAQDFGYRPRSFAEGAAILVKELGYE